MHGAPRHTSFSRLKLNFTQLKTVACCLACFALASAWAFAPARAERRRAARPKGGRGELQL